MSVTMEQVLAQLNREEPNYAQAARLGAEALPHLMRLVEEEEPGLAAKATYLAGFINAEQSAMVIDKAARNSEAIVRVAAAASLKKLTATPTSLVMDLLSDQDSGVRKWSLNSLDFRSLSSPRAADSVNIREKVEEISQNDPDINLRQLAKQVLEQTF